MNNYLRTAFVMCLATLVGCGTQDSSVTLWGNSSSYSKATGLEFNYGGVGHDKTPEIIAFCRVRVADKPVPTFTYKFTSIPPDKYTATINGNQIQLPERGFTFYVNGRDGQPVSIKVERSIAMQILSAGHEQYIQFWDKHVKPQLVEP